MVHAGRLRADEPEGHTLDVVPPRCAVLRRRLQYVSQNPAYRTPKTLAVGHRRFAFIFSEEFTQLFQERDPPPRFYVKIGISYIAFGGIAETAPNKAARIDHFCALVEDYKPQEMRKALEATGIPMSGPGALAMAQDPDGLRLQMLGVPGGLARTIIPSRRISQDEPAVQAVGFDHIVLAVSPPSALRGITPPPPASR